MGSDESHFNVAVGSDGQSHKTVSTNPNFFEEKGEPKRYRAKALLLTSLKRLTGSLGDPTDFQTIIIGFLRRRSSRPIYTHTHTHTHTYLHTYIPALPT